MRAFFVTVEKTEYVLVPSDKIGLILGKGHNNIKKIIEQSGAHCEIDKNAPPDSRNRHFVIRGTRALEDHIKGDLDHSTKKIT